MAVLADLGRSSLSNSFIFIALSADGRKTAFRLPKSGSVRNGHIFNALRLFLRKTEQFWAEKATK